MTEILFRTGQLGVGLFFLWWGADLMVKNASRFATALGVSPIIIGLSIVSVGTSTPELVVSIVAALQKSAGISIGNIIGSNIANIGLILGIGAIITPLQVKTTWVRREVPYMILVTTVFSLEAFRGYELTRLDGSILIVLLLLFIVYLGRYAFKEMSNFKEIQQELHLSGESVTSVPAKKKLWYLLLSLVGLGILILGSEWSVTAGKIIARHLGVSDMVIGLTVIAVGTSLPELATTIVGTLRGETDLVVGNVIGSNIFNLVLIGGIVSLIRPIPLEPSLIHINIPFLFILSIILLPLMRIRYNVSRLEGVLLLASYGLFLYLTLRV